MLRRVALIRNYFSDELSASIIRVTKIGELATDAGCEDKQIRLVVTANVVPSSPILVILMMERYVLPKRRFIQEPHGVNIPEDGILNNKPSQKRIFFYDLKTMVI
jgi:hypothetical protein